MTGWDIDAYGVRSVLRKVDAAAKPLEQHANAFGTHLQAAYEGSTAKPSTAANPSGMTGSPIVAAALARFSDHAAHVVLPSIASHYERVRNGAIKATEAYLRGDEQMAANAQRYGATAYRPR
ncbi:MAG: hypothetical protein JWN52_4478 [Actinomycetia bacterium]|nr:hypothetical protein [Actinomycetes bacterium]